MNITEDLFDLVTVTVHETPVTGGLSSKSAQAASMALDFGCVEVYLDQLISSNEENVH